MGLRMRRSFKVAPGLRMTVTNKSLGISAGGRAARINVNSRHGTTASVGIPGTGLSFSQKIRYPLRPEHPTASDIETSPAGSDRVSPRPGLWAPSWEKELFGRVERGRLDALQDIAARSPKSRQACLYLQGLATMSGELLGELWTEGFDPSQDPFIKRYLASSETTVWLTRDVVVVMPPHRDTLGLVLAELLQQRGLLDQAIAVVEGLSSSEVVAVSLADLYLAAGRRADVLPISQGNNAVDSVFTACLSLQRAVALRELGDLAGSRQVIGVILRPRWMPDSVRMWAWVERAKTYAAEAEVLAGAQGPDAGGRA